MSKLIIYFLIGIAEFLALKYFFSLTITEASLIIIMSHKIIESYKILNKTNKR